MGLHTLASLLQLCLVVLAVLWIWASLSDE